MRTQVEIRMHDRCGKIVKRLCGAGPTLLGALVALCLLPAAARAEGAEAQEGQYAEGGSEVCMACHDENYKYPVLAILATKHGVTADPRTPMGSAHGCQTCHGPAAAHVESGGETPVPVRFGPKNTQEVQNSVCLSCHQDAVRMNWSGSTHDSAGIACTNCHTIHTQEDLVLKKGIRPDEFRHESQASVCFGCHQDKRAEIYRISSHPLREGKIQCSDCHNVHGSMGPHLLQRPTLNETCYQCHEDKRGPFLWEHPPVREDCTNCHTPHGSNHKPLLKVRVPLLCQECHMAGFHPSTAYTGPNPVAGVADYHSLEKGCLNCHSEIHGSNHPSGPRFTR